MGYVLLLTMTLAAGWSDGLHPDLLPIAHLESGGGVNVQHAPGLNVYDTATGALGLKPVTAHEQYLRSPQLQNKWPGLQTLKDFTTKLQSDFTFYNVVALDHFRWLTKVLGSVARACFGWRHGATAALTAPWGVVSADPYVVTYFRVLTTAP